MQIAENINNSDSLIIWLAKSLVEKEDPKEGIISSIFRSSTHSSLLNPRRTEYFGAPIIPRCRNRNLGLLSLQLVYLGDTGGGHDLGHHRLVPGRVYHLDHVLAQLWRIRELNALLPGLSNY